MIVIKLSKKSSDYLSMIFNTPINEIVLNDDNNSVLYELSEFIGQMINERQWTTKNQPFTYNKKHNVLIIGASERDREETIIKVGE